MKHLVTGEEMKYLDENTIRTFGVPELVLMEQAAMAFVEKFVALRDFKMGVVFCGTGNNGADGLAIARLLNERGIKTILCKVKDVWNIDAGCSEAYKLQESICKAYGFEEIKESSELRFQSYDFVIDAVFGIGLSGPVREEYIPVIQAINTIPAITVAVDIASGIHAKTGQIMSEAVVCDYTVTFAYEKLGQILWPGCKYTGELLLAQIGITEKSWLDKKPTFYCLEEKDVIERTRRSMHSHKGTYGKLVIIAGNEEMAGAAILAAKAAYHNGVGIVKIVTTASNRKLMQTAVPEALLYTYSIPLDEERFRKTIGWADAIVIGPGMGVGAVSRKIVEWVHSYAKAPVVWDADALNIWSNDCTQLQSSHAPYILTPHLGEFSRLIGEDVPWIQEHIAESAIDFAHKYNTICVLKDFRTIIANPDGEHYINESGNNGMATAGSGDVLSGVIGSFLAQGFSPLEASAYGAYVHGLAGDFARNKMGYHGIMASDIIDGLKEVWKKVENR